jgi:hypothetical protein
MRIAAAAAGSRAKRFYLVWSGLWNCQTPEVVEA